MNIKEPQVGIRMLSLQTDRVYQVVIHSTVMINYIVYSLCPHFTRSGRVLYYCVTTSSIIREHFKTRVYWTLVPGLVSQVS